MLVLTQRIGEIVRIGESFQLLFIGVIHNNGVNYGTAFRLRESGRLDKLLSIAEGEEKEIKRGVRVKVFHVRNCEAKIGFAAPREISIHREKVYQRILKERVT